MPSYTIRGGAELEATLGRMAAMPIIRRAVERGTARLLGHISSYTRVAGPSVASYRRGFGPLRADGTVRRMSSEKLNERWTSKIEESSNSVTGIVGNNTSYGPYVMDVQRQAYMHRGRWQTDEAVLADETPWIQEEFEALMANAIAGRA